MFGEYTGLVITAGASVAVALIAMLGTLIAKRSSTPVPIQDVWKENRELRAEFRNMQVGFDVLFHWMERAISTWGDPGGPPVFTDQDRAALEKVRAAPDTME
jgi:hypothetical protein